LPDSRAHRGPDPRDCHAFGPPAWPALRAAVADLSWLLGRGYTQNAGLKLVGDRWSLTERQRLAVLRCSCSDEARARRGLHEVAETDLRDQTLLLDGFNVLTTVEAALGGAVVLVGRDGCYRDLAGVHGTYRKVEETLPALFLLADAFKTLGVRQCRWLLDRPVSNSGRLSAIMLDLAAQSGWAWEVELVMNPDPILKASDSVVATADSAVLDVCQRWFALARYAVATSVPGARVLDLGNSNSGDNPTRASRQ
jgi:hypothetical protein